MRPFLAVSANYSKKSDSWPKRQHGKLDDGRKSVVKECKITHPGDVHGQRYGDGNRL